MTPVCFYGQSIELLNKSQFQVSLIVQTFGVYRVQTSNRKGPRLSPFINEYAVAY